MIEKNASRSFSHTRHSEPFITSSPWLASGALPMTLNDNIREKSWEVSLVGETITKSILAAIGFEQFTIDIGRSNRTNELHITSIFIGRTETSTCLRDGSVVFSWTEFILREAQIFASKWTKSRFFSQWYFHTFS